MKPITGEPGKVKYICYQKSLFFFFFPKQIFKKLLRPNDIDVLIPGRLIHLIEISDNPIIIQIQEEDFITKDSAVLPFLKFSIIVKPNTNIEINEIEKYVHAYDIKRYPNVIDWLNYISEPIRTKLHSFRFEELMDVDNSLQIIEKYAKNIFSQYNFLVMPDTVNIRLKLTPINELKENNVYHLPIIAYNQIFREKEQLISINKYELQKIKSEYEMKFIELEKENEIKYHEIELDRKNRELEAKRKIEEIKANHEYELFQLNNETNMRKQELEYELDKKNH